MSNKRSPTGPLVGENSSGGSRALAATRGHAKTASRPVASCSTRSRPPTTPARGRAKIDGIGRPHLPPPRRGDGYTQLAPSGIGRKKTDGQGDVAPPAPPAPRGNGAPPPKAAAASEGASASGGDDPAKLRQSITNLLRESVFLLLLRCLLRKDPSSLPSQRMFRWARVTRLG